MDNMLQQSLAAAIRTGEKLPHFALDIGRRLRSQTSEALAALIQAIARHRADSEYARGYFDGLRSLLSAYLAAKDASVREEDALQFVRSKEIAGRLLVELAKEARRPTEVAAILGKHKAQVSGLLAKLRDLGLVEVWQFGQDGRERHHRLTLLGQRAFETLAGEDVAEPLPPPGRRHEFDRAAAQKTLEELQDNPPRAYADEYLERLPTVLTA